MEFALLHVCFLVSWSAEAAIQPGTLTHHSNSQTVMPIGLNPIGRAVEGWFWLYLRRLQSPPRSLERVLVLHISHHGPPYTMSLMYLTRGTKLLVLLTSPDCSEEPKGDWTQDSASSVQLKTRHANRVEPDWQSCFGLFLAILDEGYKCIKVLK